MTKWTAKLLIGSFLLVGFVSAPAWGQEQNARPARVGAVNYVEGQASIDAKTITPDSIGSVVLDKDQTLCIHSSSNSLLSQIKRNCRTILKKP